MNSNSDKNISKFQELLLENEDSPQFDVVLGELLRQAESEVTGKDVSRVRGKTLCITHRFSVV